MFRPLTRALRVLHALMLREMITRYGASRLGYLWAVLEPVGFIALLSLVFSQIAHSPPVGQSFPLFYATGYIGYHWVMETSGIVSRSIHVNRPLLAFPSVTPIDTILARFILQTVTILIVSLIIFGTILAIFADAVAIDLGPLLRAFGAAMLLALGIGIFNAWAFAQSKSWEFVWIMLSRPLFLISCIFFTFGSMPTFVREILWWNPIVHLVGSIRAGFYPVYDGSYATPGYVAVLALAFMVVGLAGLRAADGRVAQP
ncbi:MAG: ABC transporter permease [Pseudomonadota bacterium]